MDDCVRAHDQGVAAGDCDVFVECGEGHLGEAYFAVVWFFDYGIPP